MNRYVLLVLTLALAACQSPADVPALPAAVPTRMSVLITAVTDYSLETMHVKAALPGSVGGAALIVDTVAFGRPALQLWARRGTLDSLDLDFMRTIDVSVRALVPDSVVSFSDHTIAAGTYPLDLRPEALAPLVEVKLSRDTNAGGSGQSLRLPRSVPLTGTLVVDSVRAGIAYGTFEVDAEGLGPGEAGLVRASGQFQAPVRWPGETPPDAADGAPGGRSGARQPRAHP